MSEQLAQINPGLTTEVQTKTKTGLPLTSTLIFLGFFLLLAIGLVVFILFLNEQLNTRKLQFTQSPYCPNILCPTGTEKTYYPLDPNADPNTATYQTLNYCSINAPPTSFVQSLEVCGGLVSSSDVNTPEYTISPPTKKQVTDFAKFYNQEYVDTCGWSWKNPSPEDLNQKTPQSDPVVIALSACANQLGITDNSDIQSLQSKCGSCGLISDIINS